MRRISEINKLPIAELTDEEICKAAMHRLNTKMCGLVYRGDDGNIHFLFHFKDRAGRFLHDKIRCGISLLCSKVYTKFAERYGFDNYRIWE